MASVVEVMLLTVMVLSDLEEVSYLRKLSMEGVSGGVGKGGRGKGEGGLEVSICTTHYHGGKPSATCRAHTYLHTNTHAHTRAREHARTCITEKPGSSAINTGK